MLSWSCLVQLSQLKGPEVLFFWVFKSVVYESPKNYIFYSRQPFTQCIHRKIIHIVLQILGLSIHGYPLPWLSSLAKCDHYFWRERLRRGKLWPEPKVPLKMMGVHHFVYAEPKSHSNNKPSGTHFILFFCRWHLSVSRTAALRQRAEASRCSACILTEIWTPSTDKKDLILNWQ